MLSPKLFDHTILKADAAPEDVAQVCREAVQYSFASVCVNSAYVPLAVELLAGSDVRVCCVVGFPLGMAAAEVKCYEAMWAVEHGASEIDMVINVGALKAHEDDGVREEIRKVKEACQNKARLKVILETCLLTDEEKVRACLLAVEAGADFVKTSTGFSSGGATVEDVALMRRTVGPNVGVKASGGIRDAKTAQAMVDAGASRLGTSATVAIMEGMSEQMR